MQKCEFEGQGCPLIDESRQNLVWDYCESGEMGQHCGAAQAQMLTVELYSAGWTEALDRECPIVGGFRITSLPEGDPPEAVRQAWVDTTVPVRQGYDEHEGKIAVHSIDAIISLYGDRKVGAANWLFNAHVAIAKQMQEVVTWHFNESEGVVSRFPRPVSTIDQVVRDTHWDAYRFMRIPPLFALIDHIEERNKPKPLSEFMKSMT